MVVRIPVLGDRLSMRQPARDDPMRTLDAFRVLVVNSSEADRLVVVVPAFEWICVFAVVVAVAAGMKHCQLDCPEPCLLCCQQTLDRSRGCRRECTRKAVVGDRTIIGRKKRKVRGTVKNLG